MWHCSLRAAPDDRILSDDEWAQVACEVMHRTGLAPYGQEDDAVRWVAVRHAPDHIHLVAMLARQDGTRPQTWNDYFRVGEALPGGGAAVRAAPHRSARPNRRAPSDPARVGESAPPRTAGSAPDHAPARRQRRRRRGG